MGLVRHSLQSIGKEAKATEGSDQLHCAALVLTRQKLRTQMRFWNVTPRTVRGWKSFGTGCPLGWGSKAVPEGGICAGVK